MVRSVKSERLNYGVGALLVSAISLGVAAVVYGGGFIEFDPLNLAACIVSPLGVYTIIYALRERRDRLYYLSWGLIMFIIGLSFALHRLVNVIMLFGLLLILLAAVVMLGYWRRRG